MPFALSFIGIVLIVTGFQDTYKQLGTNLQKDFTGQQSFIYWVISIFVIGSLGYVDELKTFSRVSLVLIIIVIFISNKGVFNQFNQAVQTGDTTAVNPVGTALQGAPSGSSSTGSGGSGNIGSDLGTAALAAFL